MPETPPAPEEPKAARQDPVPEAAPDEPSAAPGGPEADGPTPSSAAEPASAADEPASDPATGPAAAGPRPGRTRARRERPPKRPGLREQVTLTIEAGRRMVDAHVALAKAELEPILENVKAASIQAGLAIGAALFAVLLLTVGTPLFLGEWWFGSMGWGILHGTLVTAAVIAACAWLILVAAPGSLGLYGFVAILVGVLVTVVCGLSLTNQAWQAVTDRLNIGLPEEWRLMLVAAGISAIVGAVIGAFVGAWRGGLRSVAGGLVAGTFVGVAVGLFTAISYGWRSGVAVGISAALVTFVALVVARLTTAVDMEAVKARFYPEQTIVTTKETLEWLQEQAPMGPKP